MAYEMMGLTGEELAERLGTCDPGSISHTQIMSEIQRRHLFAQYEATEVLKQATLGGRKSRQGRRNRRPGGITKYKIHVVGCHGRSSISRRLLGRDDHHAIDQVVDRSNAASAMRQLPAPSTNLSAVIPGRVVVLLRRKRRKAQVLPSPLAFSGTTFPEMEVGCWRFITH
jgi:hypothetical protein